MTVIPEEGGKIKILLSAEDVSMLGLSFETINCANPDTRLLLRAIYKLASLNSEGIPPSPNLLIEAYPHKEGGGVLYFTPLKERSREVKRLKLKQTQPKSCCLNYLFAEGNHLLKAIDLLYQDPTTRELKSRVYTIDDCFLLTVFSPPALTVLYEIKEFSKSFFHGDAYKKYTREYGKVLTGINAIKEIGEKISRGSLNC